jgi:N-acetylglucosaminyl-diphospho-decaprenol L-rhamnosyltransferase
MLEEIGLLDEGLYTYFDDIDLCLRARRSGWETWYVPKSRVVHLEGAATGVTKKATKRLPAYWFQARRRFFLKSYGPVYAAATDASYIAGLAIRRGRQWVLRTSDDDPPHLLADSIRNSVFGTGFRLTEVENPALPKGGPSSR